MKREPTQEEVFSSWLNELCGIDERISRYKRTAIYERLKRYEAALQKIRTMTVHSEKEQQAKGLFWDWRDEANKALSFDPLDPIP